MCLSIFDLRMFESRKQGKTVLIDLLFPEILHHLNDAQISTNMR